MVLDALGCMNNVDFEKKKLVNDNIVLDVVYYSSEITIHTSNLKQIPYSYVLIDFLNNPPKRPQSAVNDVEGVEHRWIHHV